MDINRNLKNEICAIFNVCQQSTTTHQRNAILLKQMYDKSNIEEFSSCITCVITILLITPTGNNFVDKTIKFLGSFCGLLKPIITKDDDTSVNYEEDILLKNIITFLVEASGSQEDIIRIRSCNIINAVLDNFIGIEISEKLCDDLEQNLVIRLQDPKAVVRQQAIITLYRLQDPDNKDNVIIPEFLRLMNSDLIAKVRQLCVEKIAPRQDVVPQILGRIQDVDQNVRLAAYTRLSKFARYLKISQKHLILHCGFLDKSQNIREYIASVLIKKWLQFYDNDILELMKSLRLDADEKDIQNTVKLFEKVLKVIFEEMNICDLTAVVKVNEDRLVPHELLNWEVVSFWRIYVQFLSKRIDLEDELEKIIPELIYFCKYIQKYYQSLPKETTSEEFLEQQFIIKQFFLITQTYDFGDITNRKCLNALISNILENVVLLSDVIETIVQNLKFSMPDPLQQTQYVSEIISEILYPIDSEEDQKAEQELKYQISRTSVEINKVKEAMEDAIKELDFVEAERLKHELSTFNAKLTQLKESAIVNATQIQKKTDNLTIIKCLDVAAAVLLSPKITQPTSTLQSLKEDFIHDLLINENDTIRAKALRCYGLYCIIDKETSATGIHIFYTPIFGYKNGEECDIQVLLVCISAVVDILRIYGSQLMAAPENGVLSESMEERQRAVFAGGISLTDIVQGLVDLMDDDEYDIQEKAALGLCQLVLSNRIASPSLISRLILRWCNPTSEEECNTLKQVIGFTLEKIPLLPNSSEQLIDAVFITVNALYGAPRISPLADVNVEQIAKFLIALCKTSPEADYIHSTLMQRILKTMMKNPKSKINGIYSKMLLLLEISINHVQMDEILDYCMKLLDDLLEKIVINNINKLSTKLNALAGDTDETNKKRNETGITDIIEIIEEEF